MSQTKIFFRRDIMSRILKDFLATNKGKVIRLIFSNGFQMHGRLVDYDEEFMVIDTQSYDSPPVAVPYTGITTYVPAKR